LLNNCKGFIGIKKDVNKNKKDKEVLMTRERVLINKKKDKIIVTVKRDIANNRHIFITVPGHMRWITIWKILKKLPKHLQNSKKK